MLYTKGIDQLVKNFSLVKFFFIFDRLYRSIGLRFFFLLMTIDVIDIFCCQSIIGNDTIDVFFLYHRCPTMVMICMMRSHINAFAAYDCKNQSNIEVAYSILKPD